MFCGIHSVNNFLQRNTYSKEIFDSIAERLVSEPPEEGMYRFNPHKTIFFGNYDANVIIEALRIEGYSTDWFPKRNPEKNLAVIFWEDDVRGIILNKPTFWGRHWTCLRKDGSEGVSAVYHDSKCAEPVIFATKEMADEFILNTVEQERDDEFFIVRVGGTNE